MLNTLCYSLLIKIIRNVLISAVSFIFLLVGGLALMKIVILTMQIPELRIANEFSAFVILKVVGYSTLCLVVLCAAIKSEQYRKQ